MTSRNSSRTRLVGLVLLSGVSVASLALTARTSRASASSPTGKGPVTLVTTIPITEKNPLTAFDVSWLDPDTQRLYFTDRSNATVDVIDARNDTFVKSIVGGFKGFTGHNGTSGPNGVATAGHWLFVSDSPSRVVTIDLRTDQVVSSVSTGGGVDPATGLGLRADELAYDPDDGLLLVTNNEDTPPFATLITVDPGTGQLAVFTRITYADATNGAEAPVWDPQTGLFYESIPEVNGNGGTSPQGEIARVAPDGTALTPFPVSLCQPAGLKLGPKNNLVLGCSVVFDTAGQAWTPTDTNSAAPTTLIVDAKSGAIVKSVAGVSGSDEVWFNSADDRYYLAANADAVGPVLGIIDAENNTLTQLVPASAAAPGAHSVAANPHNNHVFMPFGANNIFPNCLTGCVAVFGTSR